MPLFLFLVFFDQVTKAFFADRDFFIGPIRFIGVKNYSLPFGIPGSSLTSLMAATTGLILLSLYIYALQRSGRKVSKIGAALLLSGGVSNLIDRLRFGYVRDFIDSGLMFTFNFADLFIAVGLVLLIFPARNRPDKSNSQTISESDTKIPHH